MTTPPPNSPAPAIPSAPARPQPNPAASADQPRIVRGACYAMFAYDIGLSVDLDEAERRITEHKQRDTLRHRRRAPGHFNYSPQPLRIIQNPSPVLAALSQSPGDPSGSGGASGGGDPSGGGGGVECVLYDFGAVSVAYHIPIHGPLDSLLALSAEIFDNRELLEDSRRRIASLLEVIRPAVTKPGVSTLVEDYTVYHIAELDPALSAEAFLESHAQTIARILRSETEPLSRQEVDEALAARISYAARDLAIIDWNAAIVLDDEIDDVRAILEYANVELLEMRWLDDQLDNLLEQSHQRLIRMNWRSGVPFGADTSGLRRIAEIQMDSALLFEGVNNALKLLGDQYLARVYRLAAQRLHLPEWDASIIRKLQTQESIYQKMDDFKTTMRLETLEWIIIILIALSIVLMLI